jgi:hypothetical protein
MLEPCSTLISFLEGAIFLGDSILLYYGFIAYVYPASSFSSKSKSNKFGFNHRFFTCILVRLSLSIFFNKHNATYYFILFVKPLLYLRSKFVRAELLLRHYKNSPLRLASLILLYLKSITLKY